MAEETKALMLRDEQGRFLPGQQPPGMIRSSEQASALAKRRHELAGIAARKALAEKAQEQGAQRSSIAAVGLLAGVMYDGAIANAMDKPREAVAAGRFCLQLADMAPASSRQAATASAPDALMVSGAGLSWLRQLLAAAAGQIVDGSVLRDEAE